MEFFDRLSRHVFFTGKGGVGKTSAACATAVALAERGRRVLLVSTDPASNLDDVLGVNLSNAATPVPGVPGLSALNMDPEEAARAYRARALDPQRGVVPAEEFSRLEERLAGACTTEVAAFDEFASLLTQEQPPSAFDHVIFDTAPTGHTLRLLELPAAWSSFLQTDAAEASCVGPLSALKAQRDRYAETVAALADPNQTLLVLVARPERVALIEAARAGHELGEIGMRNQLLLVNGVFRASDSDDPLARALEARERRALREMPEGLKALPALETVGFRGACLGMAAMLAVALGLSALLLSRGAGRVSGKAKLRSVFSEDARINWLAASRLFLFGSRDLWFAIALPVFLASELGWSDAWIGAFLALWVIGYGFVQAGAPRLVVRRRPGVAPVTAAQLVGWTLTLLAPLGALTAALHLGSAPERAIVVGLAVFGALFAVNSALHSYLIVAYADSEKVAMQVGFYYMANAGGRLAGTVLSGAVFQAARLGSPGLIACLAVSMAFVAVSAGFCLPLGRAERRRALTAEARAA